MPVTLHSGDPANDLWQRCNPADLELIWPLLTSFPVPVGKIALSMGLIVVSKTLDSSISGLIKKIQEEYHIEVNNTDPGVRQRFTVCHEISHYLIHRSYIDSNGITDNILYRSSLSNKQEAEANRLAAAILLPWTLVNDWHTETFAAPPSPHNIDLIAKTFKASRLAVGYRFGF